MDASDNSVTAYRDFAYEHWMPMGARQEMLRLMSTKHDFAQPLTLLNQELGVDSATSLANMARVKRNLVARDETHEMFEFLVLSQFMYLMKHLTSVSFQADYYIMPADLCLRRKRLDCKLTWGQKRRPILLHLLHTWMIHDEGEWILCKSVEDALLKMMSLWTHKYKSVFADRVPVASWVQLLTTATNDD